jgi:hypothetical protein
VKEVIFIESFLCPDGDTRSLSSWSLYYCEENSESEQGKGTTELVLAKASAGRLLSPWLHSAMIFRILGVKV